jgi:lipopolysaccharide transport system ATP-binding protein
MLKRLALYTDYGQPFRGEVAVGGSLKAVISFQLDETARDVDAWIAFDTLTGQRVCTAHSAYDPCRTHEERIGEQTFVCEIPSLPIVPGEYRVSVGVDIYLVETDWVEDAARLTVLKSDYYGTGIVPTKGAFLIQNRWALNGKEVNVGV